MGTEDHPESRRRSTQTVGSDVPEEEPGSETAGDEGEAATPLDADGDIESTLSVEGESLVDVLNYLDDPENHPGETESLELQFERAPGTSQQNHVHGVFQRIHQICKMADDSISINAVELSPDGEDQ